VSVKIRENAQKMIIDAARAAAEAVQARDAIVQAVAAALGADPTSISPDASEFTRTLEEAQGEIDGNSAK